jgi:hypothetical protein
VVYSLVCHVARLTPRSRKHPHGSGGCNRVAPHTALCIGSISAIERMQSPDFERYTLNA